MSLSCHNVRDLVAVYKDGATSDETAQDIRRHLQECALCRQYYREYEQMDRVTYVPDDAYVGEMNYAALASRIRRSRFIQALVTLGSVAVVVAVTVQLTRWVFREK